MSTPVSHGKVNAPPSNPSLSMTQDTEEIQCASCKKTCDHSIREEADYMARYRVTTCGNCEISTWTATYHPGWWKGKLSEEDLGGVPPPRFKGRGLARRRID